MSQVPHATLPHETFGKRYLTLLNVSLGFCYLIYNFCECQESLSGNESQYSTSLSMAARPYDTVTEPSGISRLISNLPPSFAPAAKMVGMLVDEMLPGAAGDTAAKALSSLGEISSSHTAPAANGYVTLLGLPCRDPNDRFCRKEVTTTTTTLPPTLLQRKRMAKQAATIEAAEKARAEVMQQLTRNPFTDPPELQGEVISKLFEPPPSPWRKLVKENDPSGVNKRLDGRLQERSKSERFNEDSPKWTAFGNPPEVDDDDFSDSYDFLADSALYAAFFLPEKEVQRTVVPPLAVTGLEVSPELSQMRDVREKGDNENRKIARPPRKESCRGDRCLTDVQQINANEDSLRLLQSTNNGGDTIPGMTVVNVPVTRGRQYPAIGAVSNAAYYRSQNVAQAMSQMGATRATNTELRWEGLQRAKSTIANMAQVPVDQLNDRTQTIPRQYQTIYSPGNPVQQFPGSVVGGLSNLAQISNAPMLSMLSAPTTGNFQADSELPPFVYYDESHLHTHPPADSIQWFPNDPAIDSSRITASNRAKQSESTSPPNMQYGAPWLLEQLPLVPDNTLPTVQQKSGSSSITQVSELPFQTASQLTEDPVAPQLPLQSTSELPPQVAPQLPLQSASQLPPQVAPQLPLQSASQLPPQVTPQLPLQSASQLPAQVTPQLPLQSASQLPPQKSSQLPSQEDSQLPLQAASMLPPQVAPQLPLQSASQLPPQKASQLPSQEGSQLLLQTASQLLLQTASQLPPQAASQLPSQAASQLPSQAASQLPPQAASQLADSQLLPQAFQLPPKASQLPPQAASQLPSQAASQLLPPAAYQSTSFVPDPAVTRLSSEASSQSLSQETTSLPSLVATQLPFKLPEHAASQLHAQVASPYLTRYPVSQLPPKAGSQVPSQTVSYSAEHAFSQLPAEDPYPLVPHPQSVSQLQYAHSAVQNSQLPFQTGNQSPPQPTSQMPQQHLYQYSPYLHELAAYTQYQNRAPPPTGYAQPHPSAYYSPLTYGAQPASAAPASGGFFGYSQGRQPIQVVGQSATKADYPVLKALVQNLDKLAESPELQNLGARRLQSANSEDNSLRARRKETGSGGGAQYNTYWESFQEAQENGKKRPRSKWWEQ